MTDAAPLVAALLMGFFAGMMFALTLVDLLS